jgi:hypothetical protein
MELGYINLLTPNNLMRNILGFGEHSVWYLVCVVDWLCIGLVDGVVINVMIVRAGSYVDR